MSPQSGARSVVPLKELQLSIREDMRSRASGPYRYIGMPDVGWANCFFHGYGWCLHLLGVNEGADVLFGDWLLFIKKAWPAQGWDSGYLEEFHGDHQRALLKYLDFVAEFRALPPEALASIEWRPGGEHPSVRVPSLVPVHPPKPTLDMLLEVRQEIGDRQGRLFLFIGPIEVKRMAGYIDGHRLCLALAGARDEEYPRFERWLQEAKGVPAGQDWTLPFLESCEGDAERAIRRLLECAVEFRSLPPSPR
ncbi:hypothetical protein F0U59_00085 [Archangium gephyra]|nr:hypothetical protein F0U59_00085 [Archangium gephyra]